MALTDLELLRVTDSIRRVENIFGAGAGTLLNPKLKGDDPVPSISNLRVVSTEQTFGSTLATLVWDEPLNANIIGYRVWATNILKANQAPTLLGEFEHSPARVLCTSDVDTKAIVRVQPVLSNGVAAKLDNCLSVVVSVTLATVSIPDGSITVDKLAPGAIELSKYAAGQRPLQIVLGPANPTLPDAAYPIGSVILNLTDGEMYRNVDDTAWSKAVDGANLLANSVTAAKADIASFQAAILSAGSINASMLNIYNVLLAGLTLTNNSPAAGRVSWSACTVYYQGTAYNIASGNTPSSAEKFITWTVGDTSFVAASTFTPGPNVFLIATNVSGSGDTAWNKIARSSITGDLVDVPALQSAILTAGSINTSMLNLYNVLVVGLTLTDNSPAAGRVAWSACTVYHQGVGYSISSGSTASSAEKQIYWTLGNSTFTSAATYIPAPNIFPIATNTDGIADTSWNKGGNARSSVQRSNVSFGLLEGFQLQPTAFLTLTDPEIPFASGAPASLAFNLLTVNQPGVLLNCRIQTTDPYVSNPGAISLPIGVVLGLYLRYTIDGAPSQLIRLGTWSVPSSASYGPIPLDDDIQTFAGVLEGDGSAANDILITSNLGLTFTESCVVDVVLTSTGASSNPPHRKLYGETKFRMAYALKV
jgi:hypothetical protein